MRLPPRLSATAMFWWGIGLLLGGLLLSQLLARSAGVYGEQVAMTMGSFWGIGTIIGGVAYQLGIVTIVASFAVRALQPQVTASEAHIK